MSEDNDNFPLPRLNQRLQLNKGPVSHDGSPSYTLYNPVSNKYYKLDWAEFECLSRFQVCESAKDLQDLIAKETTLDISLDEIREIIDFVLKNGLAEFSDQRAYGALPKPKTGASRGAKSQSWIRSFQKLIFLKVPLFEPRNFLRRSFPYISFLFSKAALFFTALIFISGFFLVVQRPDEFFNTFVYMFSWQGLVLTLCVFALIKVIHELSHAFTATKYGVDVPHMGVAFIIFYPVLYTETTAAWALEDRRKRLAIGLAGVAAELSLAGLFFYIWYFTPDGMIRSIAFTVIAISLLNSLLINLNPLMKFDGYYVLSDYLGIDNLHSRALAFARWNIRKILFGLSDEPPENALENDKRFFVVFGTLLLIYRLFLFTAIGIALYMLFPKPFGLILMLAEIAVFVIMPVTGEVRIWWRRRLEIISLKRGRVTLGVGLAVLVFMTVPVQSEIQAPAVMTYQDYRVVYPPHSALIKEIKVQEGQDVEQGDLLVVMHSSDLQREIQKARLELTAAQTRKKLGYLLKKKDQESKPALDQKIKQARENLRQLLKKQENLTIRAPFSGTVKDLPYDIHEERYVNASQPLMRIVQKTEPVLLAYVKESQITRISRRNEGRFYADFELSSWFSAHVTKISSTDTEDMRWLSLASPYGGDLATKKVDKSGQNVKLKPLDAIYEVTLSPDLSQKVNKAGWDRALMDRVVPGYVRIRAQSKSYFSFIISWLAALRGREPVFY